MSWQHAQTLRPGLTGQRRLQQGVRRPLLRRPGEPGEAGLGQPTCRRTPCSPTAAHSARRPTACRRACSASRPCRTRWRRSCRRTTACRSSISAPPATTSAGSLDAALPVEYVRFTHPTLLEGSRHSLSPTLALPLLAPGWFVTPKLGIRHVGYDLDLSVPEPSRSPSVSIPWFSASTAGLRLRPGSALVRREPDADHGAAAVLRARALPNQDRLPVFDTALADFSYAQLFTENRFSGGDRFGDANQVTAALTSRFLHANGQEALRATIGQRYYFESERVGLTADVAAAQLDRVRRAGVDRRAALRATGPSTRPRSTTRIQQRTERYTVAARYTPEIAKVINASYRFQRDTIRQIDVSGAMADRRGLVRRRALQLLAAGQPAARRAGGLRVQRRLLGVPRRRAARPGGNAGGLHGARFPARVQRRGPDRHRRGGGAAQAQRAGLLGDQPAPTPGSPRPACGRACPSNRCSRCQGFCFSCLLLLAPFAASAQSISLLDRIVAVVNKEVITLSELNDTIATAERQLKRTGTRAPPREVLERQMLEQLILDKAQLQLARERGIRVDEAAARPRRAARRREQPHDARRVPARARVRRRAVQRLSRGRARADRAVAAARARGRRARSR